MIDVEYFAVTFFVLIPSTACNVVLLYFLVSRRSLNCIPNKYIISIVKSNIESNIVVTIDVLSVALSEDVAKNTLFCYGSNLFERSLLAVAMFTMVALSIERCKHHLSSTNHLQSIVKTRKILALVWIASFGFGIFCLIVEFCLDQVLHNLRRDEYCYLEHDNEITGSIMASIDLFALFIIPSIIIGYKYKEIVYKIWFLPCENSVQKKLKQKATILNISTAIFEIVMWVPFWIFKIAFLLSKEKRDYPAERIVLFTCFNMTCLKTLVLAILYLSCSAQTRKELKDYKCFGSNRIEANERDRRQSSNDILDEDGEINGSQRGHRETVFQIDA